MTLKELGIGKTAVITAVRGDGGLRQHLLDMGLIQGAELTATQYAPMGDPMEILVHGYSLTLRLAEASLIDVVPLDKPLERAKDESKDFSYNLSLHEHNSHPGLGEAGKYHNHDTEHPLPKDTTLTFALAGQQNCGKSTLFNQLTGSNQHVGNFPGVTVDRKDGPIKGYANTSVVDLPGVYSLSPYTAEELVSREFILKERPQGIINIVDASNIERHLYLTMQLMELNIPMVLALNMMDEVRNNGGAIHVNQMEHMLGIPVVPISAAKNEGVAELVEHAIHMARYQELPTRQDFCRHDKFGGAVHRCLHGIMHLIEDHAANAALPIRFVAAKLVEGDEHIARQLGLSRNETDMIEHIICQMEEERGLDRAAAIADMRYSFIHELCDKTVVKPRASKEYLHSKSIDKVLTGRYTAIPIFLTIICLAIWLSIDVLGASLQGLLGDMIGNVSDVCQDAMQATNVHPTVVSLVVDGIFGGVGSVLSFVPIIIVLFFFLSIIEDSGYMARIAFVTDKLLRKIGLSGRSIVPLLIGYGCSVPAIMATRTLPSAHDRVKTILLTPFMSCSAKIPVYAFLTSAFFPQHGGLVLVGLYLLGLALGILIALAEHFMGKREAAAPFVMELPNYRMPRFRNVGHLLWDKTKDFVERAFTMILVASIIIWFLKSFDFRLYQVSDASDSMMAWLSGLIAPMFSPLGLDDWRVVTSLISGFMAKESVYATMEVLGVATILTMRTAVPMLLFCLLYTPCVAAIASIRRELGSSWAGFVVVFQCAIAWLVAWIGYLVVL
ncbi:MAG: ferrous iron transport protein B [Bacteroidales bacterium]|nr:ferrous iron transport protein B [Bacteroidales bacterium]